MSSFFHFAFAIYMVVLLHRTPTHMQAIDCSVFITILDCLLDSNGGCTWISNGCRCSSPANDGDYFILLDHSGQTTAEETINVTNWLSTVINAGITEDSAIGFKILQTTNTEYPIEQKTWSEYTYFLQNNITGAGSGFRDTVGGIDSMITEYILLNNTNFSLPRIALLITSSIPCVPEACTADDYRICNRSQAIYDQDIRVIVIYVKDINNYDWGCITMNATEDVIYLNVSQQNQYETINTVTPTILDAFCPLEPYLLTITEIKAIESSLLGNDAYSAQFIELYNDYSSINLNTLLFDGLITGTLQQSLSSVIDDRFPVNTYLVIYNADQGNVSCAECLCTLIDSVWCNDAIYIPCGISYDCQFGENMMNNNWWITIKDTIQTYNIIINDLTYNNQTYPNDIRDHTVTYDDTREIWIKSCNEHGSPGSIPLVTCITNSPTNTPSNTPTQIPTNLPTNLPSISPTSDTSVPTTIPTDTPSSPPTYSPTGVTKVPTTTPMLYVPTPDPAYRILTSISIVTTDSNDNTESADTSSMTNEFEERWIWVIIIAVIMCVVFLFGIFVWKWRKGLIQRHKEDNLNTHQINNRTNQRIQVPAASPRPDDDDDDCNDGYDHYTTKDLPNSPPDDNDVITDNNDDDDNGVIFTALTTGAGGDSMYGGYDTPQGPKGTGDDNVDNDNDDDDDNIPNVQRYTTDPADGDVEELFRTQTELAKLGHVNDLPPQPQNPTPGFGTDDGGIKLGEKSLDPQVLNELASNSIGDESSSSYDGKSLYGTKTPLGK